MLRKTLTLMLAATVTFAGGFKPTMVQADETVGTITDIAFANEDFSTLVTAVLAAGLGETLNGPGPFTVFAPNNAAFAKLPPETLQALLQDTNRLRQILLYHVVSGRVTSGDLQAGKVVTVQGAAATVDLTNGVKIDGASVIAADVQASNGVIHVIDTVILPPGSIVEIASGNADFSTLVAAAQAAGLVETLSGPGPFTVFAPNNAAFAKLPPGRVEALVAAPDQLRRVLLYHVVPGRVRSTDLQAGAVKMVQGASANISLTNGIQIDGAKVIAADLEAGNGIIHVIDSVILPPEPTIVEIAASNADFSTLVTAVQAAVLAETLSGPGPFTVFAPNNAAFAKLPPGTIDALLADPERLRQVLLYHVVPGRVASTDLKAGTVPTAQGATVTVDLANGVKVNDATVIAADITAVNGIIHVIDTVILPPPSVVEIAAGNSDFSTLVSAVLAAGLAETLSGPGPFTVFAPNNAAFAKLPPGTVEALLQDTNRLRQVLLYHVVNGRVRSADLKPGKVTTVQGAAATVDLSAGVRINDAQVIAANVEAGNGVIHVIDEVLLPPPSIVEIASGNPDFSTLVAAVQAAGLVEALSGPGPFTVFAPNNAAFAKLPPGTVEGLLQDPDRLRQILLYHVVPGGPLRAGALSSGYALTLNGAPAFVAVGPGGISVDGAIVIAADIEAFNGVIHVIDDVILPGTGFAGFNLSIAYQDGKAQLKWPVLLGQSPVLESRETLTAGDWEPVVGNPTAVNGMNVWETEAGGATRFYRLRNAP